MFKWGKKERESLSRRVSGLEMMNWIYNAHVTCTQTSCLFDAYYHVLRFIM